MFGGLVNSRDPRESKKYRAERIPLAYAKVIKSSHTRQGGIVAYVWGLTIYPRAHRVRNRL